MPTYISLLRWTQQGLSNVKDSAKRLDEAREALGKHGVRIKDTYMTLGRYDLICVVEGPDDETCAKTLLKLGALGNVQTETLRAFTEDEYRKITTSI